MEFEYADRTLSSSLYHQMVATQDPIKIKFIRLKLKVATFRGIADMTPREILGVKRHEIEYKNLLSYCDYLYERASFHSGQHDAWKFIARLTLVSIAVAALVAVWISINAQ